MTLRLYFSRKVTVEYPEKVQAPAARFRGLLRLHRDERGEPLCIACKACQRACGTTCFDIEGRKEEGAKFMRPVKFDWKLDRCSFCGFCVEVCPTSAIRFSQRIPPDGRAQGRAPLPPGRDVPRRRGASRNTSAAAAGGRE
ncbi:MAG: 4Fe-4S dicluster domain-containing protein [Ignavibacteriales bacterium]|nr:4Fe-4S dicluster domain-containing protein [Ignavibacteriales bacterium]